MSTPFGGSQFLLNRSRSTRRAIENEQGEAALFVTIPRQRPSLFPRRIAAFYDAYTKERLIELRPEPWSLCARHTLVDAEGRTIARFELQWIRGRWRVRDSAGQMLLCGVLEPRWAAILALGRGRFARVLVLHRDGADPDEEGGAFVDLRSRDFDGHDLLDLGGDREAAVDPRIALALAVLVG